MTTIDTTPPLGGLLHDRRDQILEIADQHRARTERVFGRVALGESTEDSEIDLLFDFEPDSSLFDVLHLTDDDRISDILEAACETQA